MSCQARWPQSSGCLKPSLMSEKARAKVRLSERGGADVIVVSAGSTVLVACTALRVLASEYGVRAVLSEVFHPVTPAGAGKVRGLCRRVDTLGSSWVYMEHSCPAPDNFRRMSSGVLTPSLM